MLTPKLTYLMFCGKCLGIIERLQVDENYNTKNVVRQITQMQTTTLKSFWVIFFRTFLEMHILTYLIFFLANTSNYSNVLGWMH